MELSFKALALSLQNENSKAGFNPYFNGTFF